MKTKTLLRICATFEIATGVAMIAAPGFVMREFFGGSSSADIAMARGVGFGPLLLGSICWPVGGDIDVQGLCAQLAYTSLTALYLGYLRLEGGFTSSLLWPISALHGLIAIILTDLAFERFSIAKSGRAKQH
jgi:hypothetical protein